MKLKKMLAWLMTLCMMATVLPVTVLAADEQYQAVADKGTENEKYYETLQEALKDAGAANAGNTTIDILCETIDGSDWEAVKVDGYHGADIVTLNGNGATITGMRQPLFAGGFAGGSGIVINDLTIANSEIVSTNSTGSGAFIESMDSMDKIVLYNCHLKDTSVEGSRTGGLIGWTSGYNNVNDGPVKTYVTITGCSVINCEIKGTSVGAINGHAGANAWTYTTIENCKINGVNLISTDAGDWRVGVVLGTANVGEVTINNIEYDDIFMTQSPAAPIDGQTDLVGRAVFGETGKLTIDGEAYNEDCKLANPVKIEDGGKYETLADALKAAENGDNIILLQDVAVTSAIDFKGKDVVIKGATKDVELDFTAFGYESSVAANNYHADGVTFKNLTLAFPNVGYVGFHHVPAETYVNCVIEGQPFLYGDEAVFKGCTFEQKSADAYNVWTYGANDVTFEECTFNSAGKSVLIYHEGEGSVVEFIACELNASAPVEGKAAIEIDSSLLKEGQSTTVIIDENTTDEGFAPGSVSGKTLYNHKKGEKAIIVCESEIADDVTVSTNAAVGAPDFVPVADGKLTEETVKEALNNTDTNNALNTIGTNEETIDDVLPTTTDLAVAGLDVSSENAAPITVTVKPYVAIEELPGEEGELKLDIKVLCDVEATQNGTTKTVSEGEELEVTDSIQITVPLPENVPTVIVDGKEIVYVTHTEDDGTFVDVYKAEVTIVNGVRMATFTNDNGFSIFTFSAKQPVAKVGNATYTSLQAAIDEAKDGDTITLLAAVTEDVTITQKADLDLVIDGKGNTFTGVMTVFGDARHDGKETLTIKNVVFQAAEGKDSCILSPDRTAQTPARYSYSHNVTVDNCTFKGNEAIPLKAAAVRHNDGGDVNWTITNCTVDANMHSLLQVNNVEGDGLLVEDCTINSKNGINLNSTGKATITGCTFDVKGYAVRTGVKNGGNAGVENIVLTDNTIHTAADADSEDAAIVVRNSGGNAKITMSENAVTTEGAAHFGTEDVTDTAVLENLEIVADENYWGEGKTAPKTDTNISAEQTVPVISYYEDAALKNLVEMTSVDENEYPEGMTVTDGKGNFYATMKEALEGIHLTGGDTLFCKAGADVGTMTHGHVCADLTVYGNGAKVSGGEQDFELDTYKFCHNGANTCAGLTGETTLKVVGLNGAGAWGQRNTEHTINLIFEDCEDMSRIYFSGTVGETNITLKNCTFTSNTGGNCKVYSNANGEIVVENCDFSKVDVPINLNHKEAGEQTVTVKDCTFTDCGSSEYDYAAPIRVLSSVEGSATDLTINNCSFKGTVTNKVDQAADILLDYGIGDTTVTISDTNAKLFVETKTVAEGEEPEAGEVKEITVTNDEIVTASNSGEVEETPESVPTPAPSTGGGSYKPKYTATVDKDDIENGSVKLSSTRVKAGSTVTITVTPDEGYELDELKVLDKDGNEVELTDKGNGKFTFKMPKGGVEIEASFEEADEVDEPAVDKKEETTLVLTIGQVIYQLDGEHKANDVAPIIKADRTFLPIRLIAETLGATVTWNEAEQSVTIVKDDTTIVIYIGQAFALVNGEPVQLDEAAFIQNDRTYLPLRFVAETLGATVTWDGTTQTVTVVG